MTQIILSDHNCEGQARLIFETVRHLGLLEVAPMELKLFRDLDLSIRMTDKDVWVYCQQNRMILLTGNRSGKDNDDSLEQTIRRLLTPASLPVLTISNLKRVRPDSVYRSWCANRLAEIVFDLTLYRGTMRLYLP